MVRLITTRSAMDNIFAIAIRKNGVPIKFMMMDEKRIDGFKSWSNGISLTLSGIHKEFDPLANLPPKTIFSQNGKNQVLATTEVSLRFRYAFLEKFLETHSTGLAWAATIRCRIQIYQGHLGAV